MILVRLFAFAVLLWCTPLASAYAQQADWQYQNIVAAAPTTTTVKSTRGVLHKICINNPVATGTITIYDNTPGSGNKIGTITTPTSPQPSCLTYDVAFWTGLTIVTATEAQDISVSFR